MQECPSVNFPGDDQLPIGYVRGKLMDEFNRKKVNGSGNDEQTALKIFKQKYPLENSVKNVISVTKWGIYKTTAVLVKIMLRDTTGNLI